jgi:hypothetical protein
MISDSALLCAAADGITSPQIQNQTNGSINSIQKGYSSKYTDIPKAFFTQVAVALMWSNLIVASQHILALIWSQGTVVKQCVPTMFSGLSCNNVLRSREQQHRHNTNVFFFKRCLLSWRQILCRQLKSHCPMLPVFLHINFFNENPATKARIKWYT